MSQSATFYSVTADNFKKINLPKINTVSLADCYATLQQIHEGVRYILFKIKPLYAELIEEIFDPVDNTRGQSGKPDEISGVKLYISYLTPAKVKEIDLLLSNISHYDISKNYSAKEFNAAEIYPEVWQEDAEEEGQAFTVDDLHEGFKTLKKFFKFAADHDSYILVYVG